MNIPILFTVGLILLANSVYGVTKFSNRYDGVIAFDLESEKVNTSKIHDIFKFGDFSYDKKLNKFQISRKVASKNLTINCYSIKQGIVVKKLSDSEFSKLDIDSNEDESLDYDIKDNLCDQKISAVTITDDDILEVLKVAIKSNDSLKTLLTDTGMKVIIAFDGVKRQKSDPNTMLATGFFSNSTIPSTEVESKGSNLLGRALMKLRNLVTDEGDSKNLNGTFDNDYNASFPKAVELFYLHLINEDPTSLLQAQQDDSEKKEDEEEGKSAGKKGSSTNSDSEPSDNQDSFLKRNGIWVIGVPVILVIVFAAAGAGFFFLKKN